MVEASPIEGILMNLPAEVPPVVVGVEHEQPGLLHYAHSWAARWGAPLRVVHAYSFLEVAAELYSSADDGASAQSARRTSSMTHVSISRSSARSRSSSA
jgi:hypothetical protein